MPRRRPHAPTGTQLPLDETSNGRTSGSFTTAEGAAAAAFRTAAAQIEQRYATDVDEWESSPFRWLKRLPTASRAKAAEGIITALLSSAGFRVGPRTDSTHDCTVEGVPVRVKFSTLWSSQRYTFQQLPTGGTALVVLLGVSPNEAHAWIATTAALRSAAQTEPWLSIDPTTAPPALTGCGGTLAAFLAAVAHTVGTPSGVAMGPLAPVTPSP
jgi:hypothetical protein